MKTTTASKLIAVAAMAAALPVSSQVGRLRSPLVDSQIQRKPLPSTVGGDVGFYYSGGFGKSISAAVDDVARLNARVVMLTLSASMPNANGRGRACFAYFTLSSSLENADLETALANPAITTYVLAAYDGASSPDCSMRTYLNPHWYSEANAAAVAAEYADFVYRLYVRFHNSGKTFIISQFDADDAVYCGSARDFVYSADFRSQCLAGYIRIYPGTKDPYESIQGMILWLQARKLGVSLGVNRAEAEGLTGVQVHLAAALSSVHALHDGGFPSALWDILPFVPSDYVAYVHRPEPGNDGTMLTAELDAIHATAATARIILNELPAAPSLPGTDAVEATANEVHAALAWRAAYIVQHELYNKLGRGIFDERGNIAPLGSLYQSILGAAADRKPLLR